MITPLKLNWKHALKLPVDPLQLKNPKHTMIWPEVTTSITILYYLDIILKLLS